MRPNILIAVIVALAACAPGATSPSTPADIGIPTESTETETAAPVPPPPASALRGGEWYREGDCPVIGAGLPVPKGAIVQAWACAGERCHPVTEHLTVVRGASEDEVVLDLCEGWPRFEVAWVAVE